VGISALSVLATALGGVFGALGVLLGLRLATRLIARDEERYSQVLSVMDTFRGELGKIKIEWGGYQEAMEQLANTVERGRRKSAASLSAVDRKTEQLELEQAERPPMSPGEERNEARRRRRRVSG
jgi:hypothetical protein